MLTLGFDIAKLFIFKIIEQAFLNALESQFEGRF